VKLYSYSRELLTFAEAKSTRAKLTAGGILIGTIIFFGFITLNQSIGNALGFRSADTLAVENDILRQELHLMSPRVSKLEMKVRQLHERDNKLHVLLYPRTIAGDTVSRFTYATEGLKVNP
jgi:hypothetical protein